MFYREKMRAIASVIPEERFSNVLEIGGGTSGLTSLFFPDARVVNVDSDPHVAEHWPWLKTSTILVPGDATRLPFESGAFDCVTAFDVLEHVNDDNKVAGEILRVLKPGGYILASTPTAKWRYPFYKGLFSRICYREEEVMAQWGHVRRGYSFEQLVQMFDGCKVTGRASYINPLTVIAHDIAFSKLVKPVKWGLIVLQYPVTLIGYVFGCPGTKMGMVVALKKEGSRLGN
jgi:ubiquinone/menaquinone biosynthesis C-methylase UbiE